MSRDGESTQGRFVESVEDLVDFLRAGEKPPERWRVGTEHEKIGLRSDDLRPVPYEGERGIAALLERIAREDDWERIYEDSNLIALAKDQATITLEPGGQLELSGAPLHTIFETCNEFHSHLEVIRRVSEPLGLVWLSLGMNPLHSVEDAPRMPKTRYDIMRSYLPTRGDLALHMMHLTATVQANLDYRDEEDMVRKMRVATGLTPLVSAIFANSSLTRGKPNGFVSRRLHIWQNTDPDRCGLLPFVFDPGFGYARYVDWALDVPMFFVIRDGRYLPGRGTPFRSFLSDGFEGERATLEDWNLHLTTLFPDVRLKQFIEIRGADAVPPGLICALPALLKGIFYDPTALAAGWALISGLAIEERAAALEAVARRGLAAQVGSVDVLSLAREMLEIASEGLRRIGHGQGDQEDECGFLDPVREVIEAGRSPGQEILERWEGDWGHSVERLIEYSRY